VDGIAHAVALSEAAEALSREIATVEHRLFVRHGRTMTAHQPGVAMLESDSLDGPWTPIPPDAIVVQEMGVGGDGADAVVWAAMDSARRVVAFPVDKLNALQAARPGARHDRFHAGDVVTLAELETLASAARLLSLRAPAELLVGLGEAPAMPLAALGRGDNDDAKPPNLPTGLEAIDEHDAALLAFLNRTPGLRRNVSDVLPDNGPQDRKSVAKRLRKLADRNPPLVDYPKDRRSGVVILPAGVEALKRATSPTPH